MKLVFAIIFSATVILLAFCSLRAKKSDNPIKKYIISINLIAIFSVLANLVTFMSLNFKVVNFAFSLFFCSISWLLFAVLQFVVALTKTKVNPTLKKLFILILCTDSLLLLFNNFFSWAYDINIVISNYNEQVFVIEGKLFYNIHLIISYFIIILTFLILLIKIIKTPKVYKRRYLIFLITLIFIVLLDAVYVFLDKTIDISIFLFSITGILFYYYALVYKPKHLILQMLSLVVSSLKESVLLFDNEGDCIYANPSAKYLIDFLGSDCLVYEKTNRKLDLSIYNADKSFERVVQKYGKNFYYKYTFKTLYDDKKRYLGGFFVVQDNTLERHKTIHEHFLASFDKLTGVYNRDMFLTTAEAVLKENPAKEFLMICSDIKNFKLINDEFGKTVGDEILINIARTLEKYCRHPDVFGRIDNDRFGLLMPKEYYKEDLFLSQISQIPKIKQNESYPISLYIGIYEIEDINIPVEIMCDRAFLALETIKGNRQNYIAYYDKSLRDIIVSEQNTIGNFELALQQNQFRIYLQPQFTANKDLYGAEVLIRWIHPDKGIIPPKEFIPIFERNGLITSLDQYVWEQTCMLLKKWQDDGINNMCLSVNISPKDFYYVDIYNEFINLVNKYSIDPCKLRLEITETAVISNLPEQLILIKRLRDAGFTVEMDDFGSGNSSLNTLKDINIDVLKIDMGFLGKTQQKERSEIILNAMIDLAKKLNLKVISEGVEDEYQKNFLMNAGTDIFQGYLFEKPIPVEDFEKTYIKL